MTDQTDPLGPIAHILAQAANGEFAILDSEARSMTAFEFAAQHNTEYYPWGLGGCYTCVLVDNIEYLWLASTGAYDGWNMAVQS